MIALLFQGALPSKDALDRSLQCMDRVVNSFFDGRRLLRDGDGLATFESGFHHAASVVVATLVADHVT